MDQCHPSMGQCHGWISAINQSVPSIDRCHRLISAIDGSVPLTEQCHRWVSDINGSVPSTDQCHPSISAIDHPATCQHDRSALPVPAVRGDTAVLGTLLSQGGDTVVPVVPGVPEPLQGCPRFSCECQPSRTRGFYSSSGAPLLPKVISRSHMSLRKMSRGRCQGLSGEVWVLLREGRVCVHEKPGLGEGRAGRPPAVSEP